MHQVKNLGSEESILYSHSDGQRIRTEVQSTVTVLYVTFVIAQFCDSRLISDCTEADTLQIGASIFHIIFSNENSFVQTWQLF